MTSRSFAGLLLVALAAGCVQAGENAIDHARGNGANDTPQESVAGPDETNASASPDVSNVTFDSTTEAPTAPTPAPTPTPTEVAPTPEAPPTPEPTPPPTAPSPAPPPPSPSTPPTPPPSPAPTPAPTTWPREGSYVKYTDRYATGAPDGSFYEEIWANASWTYTNGDWHGACDEQTYSYTWSSYQTPDWHNSTRHVVYDAAHPPHWPPFDTTTPPAAGSTLKTWYLQGCTIEAVDFQVFAGTDSEPVSVNGQTRTVPTFLATDTHDGSPNDFHSEWRRDTGLVVMWTWAQSNTGQSGRIVDTG